MPVRRVPLDEVADAVLAGDVHNGTLVDRGAGGGAAARRAVGPGCDPSTSRG